MPGTWGTEQVSRNTGMTNPGQQIIIRSSSHQHTFFSVTETDGAFGKPRSPWQASLLAKASVPWCATRGGLKYPRVPKQNCLVCWGGTQPYMSLEAETPRRELQAWVWPNDLDKVQAISCPSLAGKYEVLSTALGAAALLAAAPLPAGFGSQHWPGPLILDWAEEAASPKLNQAGSCHCFTEVWKHQANFFFFWPCFILAFLHISALCWLWHVVEAEAVIPQEQLIPSCLYSGKTKE